MNPTSKSLAIVACGLAKQHGITVHLGHANACTNGRQIYLPAMPDDNDEAIVLSAGFIDHEAGHCRHTAFDSQIPATGIRRTFFNAIEDCRMEILQGTEYPGCRVNLDRLVTHLVSKKESPSLFRAIQEGDTPSRMLQAYVLQRGRSMHVGQHGLDTAFEASTRVIHDALPAPLLSKVDQIVDSIPNLESTADAIAAADRLMDAIRDAQPDLNEPDTSGKSGGSDGSGEPGDSDDPEPSESKDFEASDDSDDSDEDANSGEPNDSGESGHNESDDSNPSGDPGDSVGSDESGAPAPKGADQDSQSAQLKRLQDTLDAGDQDDAEQNLGEAISRALDEHATRDPQGGGPSNAPAVTFGPGGNACTSASRADIDPVDVGQCQRATVALRTKLTSFLEAQSKTRTRHTQSGVRIDRRRLPTIAHPNAAVFLKKRRTRQVATGVHVLVDRSRSMRTGGRMAYAGQAAYAVMSALERIQGVVSACSAFPGYASHSVVEITRCTESLAKTKQRYVPAAYGGTPLTEALWHCGTRLWMQSVDRRILVVMTDGRPNDEAGSRAALQHLRSKGIECVGIGIAQTINDMFGDGQSARIDTLDDLAPELFRIMRGLLAAAYWQ